MNEIMKFVWMVLVIISCIILTVGVFNGFLDTITPYQDILMQISMLVIFIGSLTYIGLNEKNPN